MSQAGRFESLPFHQLASGARGRAGARCAENSGETTPRRTGGRPSHCASFSAMLRKDIPAAFVGPSPGEQVVCFVDHGMSLRSAGVEISSMCRKAGAILSI